jgi:L-ribulose-5-phosphate 4-epimerase
VRDEEARRALAATTRELYDRQLVTAGGGNLSVRSPERPGTLWITPSGIFKGGLGPEDMVLVDLDGNQLEGPHRPSVETGYHAGIMRARPHVGAVVHSHAPLATVFAVAGMDMLPVTTEAVLLAGYPTCDFRPGGSHELHDAVMRELGATSARGAFLRNHGLVTVGATLREAADETYMVEHTCRILILTRLLGVQPALISPETVDLLTRSAGLV